MTTTSHSKKPEVGDLVGWRGEIGIIKQTRGIDIQVHWVSPWMEDDRLIDASWLRRASRGIQVISRGCEKSEKK